ncbi:ABC transporter ATP-binding protein [Bradyrhizobium liaoningense]
MVEYGLPLLEARGITKTFGGFLAIDNVNLTVRRGEIHALIGPNGAGKTTVFNVLTKFHQPTSGSILFDGKDITDLTSAEIARIGLVRSFQISAVFPHLTLIENVRLALQRPLGISYRFWQSEKTLVSLNARAVELLSAVGLEAFRDLTAGEMPYGRRRALELATTLALDPQIMLLDEPTQGMGHEDIERVTALIKRVSHGRTVLMVEHNMSVVAGLCDRITVLQRGRVLAEGTYAEVSRNPDVLTAYMGSDDVELEGAHG